MDTSPVRTTSDKDLAEGQRVGEYVIEAKIGEGGFGAVFRASHPLIGKLAAIKVLNRQYSADPEMVSRFVAEARAVNQIRHRNIIDIFAFGQIEDGRSYYVMEYLDGEPLDEYLTRTQGAPLAEAIPILRAVARALDAAHAKGIAHRDLKPENIFLARESDGTIYPKLLDFGIAKLLGTASGTAMHKTRTGAPIGTPYYMSPEQCRGRDVDHRTDIYAFGCVAYKLLTGVVPFDGEDYMDILLKQIGEEPTPPSERNPELPRAIDDAIAWMMKKDPAARPPNLITAMRALEEAAQAAGVVFSPDQQTGLHASQTSKLSAQRTPSAITPLPKAGTPSFGNAATVDAARLSEAFGATQSSGQLASVGAVSGVGDTPVPAKKSPVVLIVAVLGALAVGAIVFFVVRSNKGEGDGEKAPPAVTEKREEPPPVEKKVEPVVKQPEPPPKPQFVTIRIEGAPEGTRVHGPGGKFVGAVPEIQLDYGEREIILNFEADGYEVASRKVTPSADATLEVVLEKEVVVKEEEPGKGKGPSTGSGRTGRGKGKGKGTGKGTETKSGDGKGTGTATGRDTLEDPFGTK
jgi:serine/threonine-protein kinase